MVLTGCVASLAWHYSNVCAGAGVTRGTCCPFLGFSVFDGWYRMFEGVLQELVEGAWEVAWEHATIMVRRRALHIQ